MTCCKCHFGRGERRKCHGGYNRLFHQRTLTLIAPLGTETLVVANQVIRDNVVTDIGNVRATMLDNSVVGTLGIGQVNQDAGVASNQANLLLLTSSTGGTGDVFHDYNLIAHRVITGNTLTLEGGSRTNTIQNSFNNAQGYFQVNQNTGNLNAQANVGVVSIGAGAGTAFAIINDKTLAGYTAGNTVADSLGRLRVSRKSLRALRSTGNLSRRRTFARAPLRSRSVWLPASGLKDGSRRSAL